jgi:hypothetical protein
MTDMGGGWLGFSINSADYSSTLGMFLTVVLREDDARNKERFFGINSMMSPNDWAGFDGSWENRIKIEFPFVKVVTIDPSPYLPGTDNPADPISMGKDIKITYKILSPLPFTADSAILDVRDKFGVVVYTDNTIPRSGGTHTVTWLVSTASLRSVNSKKGPYEVKITITKETESADDVGTFDVEPSTVVLEVEESVTTGLPLVECMEGREITFTATARGFVSENNSRRRRPTSADHTILFTFLYRDANGTSWTATDWSFDLVEDNTQKADKVPAGNADHCFVTPIRVLVTDDYTHQAVSPYINIKVYELWIDHFRDAATGKDWKVCVGSNIAYKAISSMDCKDWKWDMQDGVPDAWNPSGGDAKEGTAMKIPRSDLPRAANRWFGKRYGTVDVYCKDEEGNPHHFYSTSMNPSMKAEVFFPPDIGSVNPSAAVSTANPPCWFKFWKDGRVVDGIRAFRYDHTAHWGLHDAGKLYLGRYCRGEGNSIITITLLDGVTTRTLHTVTKKHLDQVAGMVVHELQHKYIYDHFGRGRHSDRDGINDREENRPSSYLNCSYPPSNPRNANSFGFSSYGGYEDNEVRSRIVETDEPATTYPDRDWSATTDNPKW